MEGLEWNETTRGRSFHSKLFESILNEFPGNRATDPNRKYNPTDFCGGTAQLDPKTGVPSRGQRLLSIQRINFHANIPQGKPQSRRCEPSKSHLRGKSRSYDIAIAARRRLLKFLTSVPRICQKYIASLVRRPVFSLVRLLVRPCPYRVAPAAGESFGSHICPIPCSLCHLMPSHVHPYTPMVLQQMSHHSQHQSTARIRVPSRPFGLAEQGVLFEHFFFLFQMFQAGERLESIRF